MNDELALYVARRASEHALSEACGREDALIDACRAYHRQMIDPTLAERIAALRAEVKALWLLAHTERMIAQVAMEKAEAVWIATTQASEKLCVEIYRLEDGT